MEKPKEVKIESWLRSGNIDELVESIRERCFFDDTEIQKLLIIVLKKGNYISSKEYEFIQHWALEDIIERISNAMENEEFPNLSKENVQKFINQIEF
ncbi:MAG: hypothetical protein ABI721_01385 [Candidatus Dojkabacteria bacterium]